MRHIAIVALFVLPFLSQIGFAEPGLTSFAYVLQADSFANTKTAAIEKLAASERDWIVLDAVFDDETPWSRTDFDAIRSHHPRRKIIAYISIGEAEDYRPYWQSKWGVGGKLTTAAPTWLGEENPDWQGNYRVHYWHTEWQNLILAAIDDALASGFDGVYLDIVDGFETFEQKGKVYIDDRINPATKQSFRRDMVDWVKTIATRARQKNPDAIIIPQNGSQLLAHQDYLDTISAIGIEDLFTNGNKLQSKSHTTEVLGFLQPVIEAQKPVLLIEYPKKAAMKATSIKLAQAAGFVLLVTDRELKSLGTSGK